MSETDLSRSIQRALEAIGVWVERIQAGEHKVRGGYLRCASPGTPDLMVIGAPVDGCVTFLEVKGPKGRLEESQEDWHERARARGIRVFVVRSVAEALEAIRS
jgi:hypothetical protein